jgi:hypothetical protein
MKSDVRFIADEQRIRPKDSELFRLKGNNTLINELTGWKLEYSIERRLKDTIARFN